MKITRAIQYHQPSSASTAAVAFFSAFLHDLAFTVTEISVSPLSDDPFTVTTHPPTST